MADATLVATSLDPLASREPDPRARSQVALHGAFLGAAALLFVLGSVVTVVWCASMSAMGAMPMPGGWGLSMAWMRMPGQTWLGVAASSLAMWLAMMVAMMLPCLVPMLMRYRRTLGAGAAHSGRLTALAGLGYFFVWTALGMIVLPLGFGLAALELQQPAAARAVPITAGIVVLVAGALQLSRWKVRALECCGEPPASRYTLQTDLRGAWRHGVHLGLRCVCCCGNLMAVLLVVGIMDLPAMALVTGALTVERVMPVRTRVAQAVGFVMLVMGVFLIGRAIKLG